MTDPMRCWDCKYSTPCGNCPMPFELEGHPEIAPEADPVMPALSWWPETAREAEEGTGGEG